MDAVQQRPKASLVDVATEIQTLILSELDKQDVLRCRLVSNGLSPAATALAFRHIQLEA
jgi:hypothetical protein